nr:hypothetical protein [Frigoribacterium sp. CFBP 13729]
MALALVFGGLVKQWASFLFQASNPVRLAFVSATTIPNELLEQNNLGPVASINQRSNPKSLLRGLVLSDVLTKSPT